MGLHCGGGGGTFEKGLTKLRKQQKKPQEPLPRLMHETTQNPNRKL
jgi:hypothetical protein